MIKSTVITEILLGVGKKKVKMSVILDDLALPSAKVRISIQFNQGCYDIHIILCQKLFGNIST